MTLGNELANGELMEIGITSHTPSVQEEVGGMTEDTQNDLYLRFNVSILQPNYALLFHQMGGSIGAAAGEWATDFSLTGSATATVAMLKRNKVQEVTIKVPSKKIKYDKNGNYFILPDELRLDVSTSRIGPGINGGLVSTVVGQGSEHVITIMTEASHAQIPFTYSSWGAYSSSIAVSEVRFVSLPDYDRPESVSTVAFQKRGEQLSNAIARSVVEVSKYAEQAFNLRQHIVYPKSEGLTKTVFKETVGVGGSGYSLLHDAVERGSPFDLKTLNSLFQTGITAIVGDTTTFMSDTDRPGSKAAKSAFVVASATSLVVNFLVAYRADGRNFVSDKGPDFGSSESWLRQENRDCLEGNDCDGAGLLAVGILNTAADMSEEDKSSGKYPYLNAVSNVVNPFYQVGLSVLGAVTAEASSLTPSSDGEKGAVHTVAGHAIAVMLPSMDLLQGVHKSMSKTLENGNTLQPTKYDSSTHGKYRFDAIFTKNVKDRLPAEDNVRLDTWESALANYDSLNLEPFAVEGTTPASPVMYMKNTEERTAAESHSKRDAMVFAMAGPNVFRSIKSLHIGGSSSGHPHQFYEDLVEITFRRTSPLYSDNALRQHGIGASQFVLCKNHTESDKVSTAGATPMDIVHKNVLLVPIVNCNREMAEILDVGSVTAGEDVVAPRANGPLILTKYQTACLNLSMSHIEKLRDTMAAKEATTHTTSDAYTSHTVRYITAFSTLVYNSNGVAQFCSTMSKMATKGSVKITPIEGLAVAFGDKFNNDVGYFVEVNAEVLIPVT